MHGYVFQLNLEILSFNSSLKKKKKKKFQLPHWKFHIDVWQSSMCQRFFHHGKTSLANHHHHTEYVLVADPISLFPSFHLYFSRINKETFSFRKKKKSKIIDIIHSFHYLKHLYELMWSTYLPISLHSMFSFSWKI